MEQKLIEFETFVADDKTCGVRYKSGKDWSSSSPVVVTGLSPEQATAVTREFRRVYLAGRSHGALEISRAASDAMNKLHEGSGIHY